jgi:hypothetical protein
VPCTEDKIVTSRQADRSFDWGALDDMFWEQCGEICDGGERREISEPLLEFTRGMRAKVGRGRPTALADKPQFGGGEGGLHLVNIRASGAAYPPNLPSLAQRCYRPLARFSNP